ncbi:kelch-like protein 3 [Paramacrobiotus metropolitanus]|uniref:kelch-like protein 3 n=1 Tax=Paramacrobiotus metropolitanus TaxID=2943436 RepID=UPI002445660B|nr:kelch-like protein 3 [Paramacrobiotus metropolitanus]
MEPLSIAEIAGKRKAGDAGDTPAKSVCIKPDPGSGISASVSGQELAQRAPPQLVAVLTGTFVLYSPRTKVEALALPCHRQVHECRVLLPRHIDPWAAHLVLLATLHPRLPLDASVQDKGVGSTASQLQAAAAFFKIPLPVTLQEQDRADKAPKETVTKACQTVQLAIKTIQTPAQSHGAAQPTANAPSPPDSVSKAPRNPGRSRSPLADPAMAYAHLSLVEVLALIRQDFLPVTSEMEVYQRVMNWCHVHYPARWTAENFHAVAPEIRWDLLPDVLPVAILTAAGPLRDVLLELQAHLFPPGLACLTAAPRERHFTEVACLFFTDRHTASLRLYDARHNKLYPVKLPMELQTWNRWKEMGPVVNNRVWFRIEHGTQLRTYAWSTGGDGGENATMEFIGEEPLAGAVSPLVSLDGLVYGWTTSAMNNTSYSLNPESPLFRHSIRNPRRIRKDAAFDVWNRYFYLCGGYPVKGRNRDILATVEAYDAATDQWRHLPVMSQSRCSFAAKVLNGYLYVTGGVGDLPAAGARVLGSCERLQLGVAGAQWQSVAGLGFPRYGHCMFVLHGKLYVCGGCNRDGMPLTAMEEYDAAVNLWSAMLPAERPGVRYAPVSACVTLTVSFKMLR